MLYLEFPAGADDADRNLAAVGDEEATEAHRIPSPARLAFLQEGRESLLALFAGAQFRDHTRSEARPPSAPWSRACVTAPSRSPARPVPIEKVRVLLFDCLVESVARNDPVYEADLARPFGAEPFPCEEQGSRMRNPDLAYDER